VEKRLP